MCGRPPLLLLPAQTLPGLSAPPAPHFGPFPPAPALSLRFGPLPRASASSLCSGTCARTLLLPPHPDLSSRFGPFTSVLSAPCPSPLLLRIPLPAFLPSADPSRPCQFADPSLPGRSLLWPCHLPPFALPFCALPASPFAHAKVPPRTVSLTPQRVSLGPPLRLARLSHPAALFPLSDFHPPAALPHPPALPPTCCASGHEIAPFLLWANRRVCVPPRPCVQVLLFKMP